MEQIIHKLHEYLKENNPDLLMQLEQEGNVTTYLSGKTDSVNHLLKQFAGEPGYIIEEVCMDILTQDLRPSKFNYVSNILLEEFENNYQQFVASGTLQFEVINMIDECQVVFDAIGFKEANEDSPELRNAVTGTVAEYLSANR